MKPITLRNWMLVCVVGCAPSAHAQLNLPNALIEPVRKKPELPNPKIESDTANTVSGPAVEPPRLTGNNTSAGPAADVKQDAQIALAKNALAGFNVSAIVGNTAILRRAVLVTAPVAAGVPALANGQMLLPPAAPAAGQALGANAISRTESLTLKNGEQFDLVPGGGMFTPKISGGRVMVYYDLTDNPVKSAKKIPVFAGELDVVTVAPKPIVLQVKDTDLKNTLKLQAGTNSSGSGTSATNSGLTPTTPAPVMVP